MAASYTASGATISSIRPSASASLASTNRPVNTRSLALLSPIARASRAVSPGGKPARISVAPNLTLSPATRQSAASASVSPLPRAYPVIAATVGFGIAPTASTASRPTCAAPAASSAFRVCSTATSSPARENLVSAEHDHRSDVVACAEFGSGGDDFAAHLPGQRIGRRPRQQQGGDARMLVEGVDADELPHGVRPPSAWL